MNITSLQPGFGATNIKWTFNYVTLIYNKYNNTYMVLQNSRGLLVKKLFRQKKAL